MDVSYTHGAYFPYYTNCGFILSGSPSPPTSLCSEPIQIPMLEVRCNSPGIQQKTPKIQLLNKTMVDARRKKTVVRGPNLPCRMEPPDMINFFQTMSTPPDHLSDSGEGSIKCGSESPQFRYTNSPYTFSQSQSTPFQYPRFDAPFQYPQTEQKSHVPFFKFDGHNQQTRQQHEQYSSAYPAWGHSASSPHPVTRKAQKQPKQGTEALNSKGVKKESVEIDSKFKRKVVKPKRKPTTPPAAHKKGLITTRNTDVLKKERTKHNVRMRKHRKRVQQKNKSLHKTELCTHWTLTSNCTFKGKCYFAHGIDELQKRVRVGNFKTRPCLDCPPKEAQCLFGSRCNYAHPGEAIRRAVGSSYVDRDYYTNLRKEFKDNDYPFGIFV